MVRYFKITNYEECHYGYQYHDGLNILKEPFDANPDHSCCKGGLYFTSERYVHKFYDYGCWVREVFLPTDNPNFRCIADPRGCKWRSNMIILGKRYKLNIDTILIFGLEFGDFGYPLNIDTIRESIIQDIDNGKYDTFFNSVKKCDNMLDIEIFIKNFKSRFLWSNCRTVQETYNIIIKHFSNRYKIDDNLHHKFEDIDYASLGIILSVN